MAIFKVKSFARFARKHSIADVVLWMAAQDVLVGAFEADLGGGVYKKRVARRGGGKSGGFRTFITQKSSEHLFFVYGFPKSERDDIDDDECIALKRMARELGGLAQSQIRMALKAGELVEVQDESEKAWREEARH